MAFFSCLSLKYNTFKRGKRYSYFIFQPTSGYAAPQLQVFQAAEHPRYRHGSHTFLSQLLPLDTISSLYTFLDPFYTSGSSICDVQVNPNNYLVSTEEKAQEFLFLFWVFSLETPKDCCFRVGCQVPAPPQPPCRWRRRRWRNLRKRCFLTGHHGGVVGP